MKNNVIKQSRINRNLKQEDVADEMKVSVQTYSKWENGVTEPKASQVAKLSSILKVTEKEICHGKLINNNVDMLDFMRKVDSLRINMPGMEFLMTLANYIDDKEKFLTELLKQSQTVKEKNNLINHQKNQEKELKNLADEMGISLNELIEKINS